MEMTSLSQSQNNYIYFDNAATSFPKPKEVVNSIVEYITGVGGNRGRSGHELSIKSGEIVFDTREKIADFFGVYNPMHIILCSNATEALNLAIQGIIRDNDHVITTSMEHNSTIRPLRELGKKGKISLTIHQCSKYGEVDLRLLEESIKPDTRLMVINHASNVFGTIQPLREIGEICRRHSICLIADCAQSAGIIPIDMQEDKIDLLAFAGHKGLMGPTGTGGLIINDEFDYRKIEPLKYGGTGSFSDKTEQPRFLPDIFESGTLNVAGLSGLYSGISYIESLNAGLESIISHKRNLVNHFVTNAHKMIKGFTDYTPVEKIITGVVSFNIEGMSPSEISRILSDEYKIMCRSGLHCAPLAHETIGTFPGGTARFSFSLFNNREEINTALKALKKISRR